MSTLVESRLNGQSLGNAHKITATTGGSSNNRINELKNIGENAASSSAQQQIPEVNVNGGAPPQESTSVARSANMSAASSTTEQDSGWGSNFWVTLIEPQVRSFVSSCWTSACR